MFLKQTKQTCSAKPYNFFKPKKEGHSYACDLVGQVTDMNKGVYLHDDADYLNKSSFCIGVAG
jgi:methylenetetrahydrofolate reductase (NADPH)